MSNSFYIKGEGRSCPSGTSGGSKNTLQESKMMKPSEIPFLLQELKGQSWKAFLDKMRLTEDELNNSDEEDMYAKKRNPTTNPKATVLRLDKSDMGLYGLYPETDEFCMVVCNICSAVVKPQGLENHMRIRHNGTSTSYYGSSHHGHSSNRSAEHAITSDHFGSYSQGTGIANLSVSENSRLSSSSSQSSTSSSSSSSSSSTSCPSGTSGVSKNTLQESKMMKPSEIPFLLQELKGQSWKAFLDKMRLTEDELNNSDEEEMDAKKRNPTTNPKATIMRLDKSDMGLYGLYPETDEFCMVVCNICSAVVKPQGLENHMRIRHNGTGTSYYGSSHHGHSSNRSAEHAITSDHFGSYSQGTGIANLSASENSRLSSSSSQSSTSSSSSSSSSTSCSSAEKIPSSTSFKGDSNSKHIKRLLSGLAGPTTSITSAVQPFSASGSRTHAKTMSAPALYEPNSLDESDLNLSSLNVNVRPSKTSISSSPKDRGYKADHHCGVPTGESGRPCTRSLTCKTHTLAMRRMVPGRSKSFDRLLADHKAAYQQAIPEMESSNSSSSLDLERRSIQSIGSNSNLSVDAQLTTQSLPAATTSSPVPNMMYDRCAGMTDMANSNQTTLEDTRGLKKSSVLSSVSTSKRGLSESRILLEAALQRKLLRKIQAENPNPIISSELIEKQDNTVEEENMSFFSMTNPEIMMDVDSNLLSISVTNDLDDQINWQHLEKLVTDNTISSLNIPYGFPTHPGSSPTSESGNIATSVNSFLFSEDDLRLMQPDLLSKFTSVGGMNCGENLLPVIALQDIKMEIKQESMDSAEREFEDNVQMMISEFFSTEEYTMPSDIKIDDIEEEMTVTPEYDFLVENIDDSDIGVYDAPIIKNQPQQSYEKENDRENYDYSDDYMRNVTHWYGHLPKPLYVNQFGLVKIRGGTTFRKNILAGRKTIISYQFAFRNCGSQFNFNHNGINNNNNINRRAVNNRHQQQMQQIHQYDRSIEMNGTVSSKQQNHSMTDDLFFKPFNYIGNGCAKIKKRSIIMHKGKLSKTCKTLRSQIVSKLAEQLLGYKKCNGSSNSSCNNSGSLPNNGGNISVSHNRIFSNTTTNGGIHSSSSMSKNGQTNRKNSY